MTANLEPRGTIVIAEDDPVTRMLLCRVLTKAHFTVHACENGLLACDAVRREAPDVVLLDWMMPVMDGPAAVEYLKANVETRAIPVVMLTTQSDVEERVVALRTGIQDFMTKPFDSRELIARIDQQIRWRKLLAVDTSAAFTGDRLRLYRSAEQSPKTRMARPAVPGLLDRMWGQSPKPPRLRPKR
jgi:DNA-binding response OmpR family regulator